MLPIYDALHPLFAGDDKWPEKIIIVMLHLCAEIPICVTVEKGRGQVGDELLHVLLLPTVFALKVIYRIFPFVQHVEDVTGGRVDCVVGFAHNCPPMWLLGSSAWY